VLALITPRVFLAIIEVLIAVVAALRRRRLSVIADTLPRRSQPQSGSYHDIKGFRKPREFGMIHWQRNSGAGPQALAMWASHLCGDDDVSFDR
jgi:hypothetical protein